MKQALDQVGGYRIEHRGLVDVKVSYPQILFQQKNIPYFSFFLINIF